MVQEYLLSIRNNYSISDSTKNCYFRHIKAFIKYCNGLGFNIDVPVIKSVCTVKKVYSDEDISRLLVRPTIFKEFTEYRNYCIILTFVDTGIRSGSLRNIRRKDVDLYSKTITLSHTKQNRSQMIFISDVLAKALNGYINRFKDCSEWLFPDQFGNQLSENGLKQAIRKYNLKHGVNITSCHSFRHYFSKSYLLKCNGDAFRLQRHLGHSTLTVTKEYCSLYDKDLINDTSPLEVMVKRKIGT